MDVVLLGAGLPILNHSIRFYLFSNSRIPKTVVKLHDEYILAFYLRCVCVVCRFGDVIPHVESVMVRVRHHIDEFFRGLYEPSKTNFFVSAECTSIKYEAPFLQRLTNVSSSTHISKVVPVMTDSILQLFLVHHGRHIPYIWRTTVQI